ncbi:hypothetical protein OJF2_10880 [Aquisphaera giovannonii]|uniref:Uncharacterized protein n=1 Tax=Aquisphaera giovannonii TaxID=406548 RepID=A0A5B9VWX4_9BACT|nr:hypothetical protein [Aquisphaera giovannonii]QEH32609.1 hypothetical protein OJF2_10880 [Aquisphaera giovannonii]
MGSGISVTIALLGTFLSAAWPAGLDGGEGPPSGDGSPPARKVAIAPGTVVNDRAPRTWSHVVLKALPRMASGDLDTLPSSAARTAALFRTAILADVGPSASDPERFVLRRIGVGLCVPQPGRGDVVVDSESAEDVGVSLGMIEGAVLKSAEAEVNRGRLVASTSTFALYRGPALLQVGEDHHKVVVSYAFLADGRTGALRVLSWGDDLDARKAGGASTLPMVELAPGLAFDCRLNVKAERLLGAVPVSWSFAMESLPPGEPRPMTDELAQALAKGKAPLDGERVEDALRRSLAVSGRQTMSRPPSAGSAAARGAASGSGPGRSARISTGGSAPRGTTPRAR